ncbi:MAG: ATP-binding protein [Anaerolineaceae bacterium]|nr:ATP-binding protein [Anaerolineaceae bacterium]
MSVLNTHDLTIGYKATRRAVTVVAEELNLTLEAGELVCLIGPNGVGKSTLLRTIAGLQAPLSGQVLLNGDDIYRLSARELARRLSMVLTGRVEVGVLSAYELVALGRHPYTNWAGRLTAHDEAVVRWAIESVGAVALAGRNFGELSDGERQKILIARALAQEPELMLLDEPTAFLDLPRRVEMLALLRELAHETGRAILLSIHDLDLALRSADRIWLLANDGTMHVGAPEDLVLTGAFAEVFHSEGVTFDPQTGSFALHVERGGVVSLAGDGLPLIWTRRALERAGFEVVSNGTAALAKVTVRDGVWQVTRHGENQQYESVHALVDALITLQAQTAQT